MGLYSELPPHLREVDIIIAGGGTAGCVIAARLADASPDLTVLVVESGPNNHNDPSVLHPGLLLRHLLPGGKLNYTYNGRESKEVNGRSMSVTVGRVLGGGSSINSMMYARGQKSDYDSWNAKGWRADDMLPYLKKFETYHGQGNAATHGFEGPVHVSGGSFRCTKAIADMTKAAKRLGLSDMVDLQGLESDAINGINQSLRFVSKEGVRQDAAHCYLHPRLQDGKHPNLHVLVDSVVVKVLLEHNSAVGIAYAPSNNPASPNSFPVLSKIHARKMVIVTCGTLSSPSVLERSGIGANDILEKAHVKQTVDLPGVGSSYEDHQVLWYPYKTSLRPDETLDSIIQCYEDDETVIKKNPPQLGSNAQEMSFKLRPTEDEVDALGPEFRAAWETEFLPKPDRPVAMISFSTCFPGYDPTLPQGPYLGMCVASTYPFSRGYIHITGDSPSDPVDFDPGVFADKDDIDLKKHIWAYKRQREYIRRMDAYRGEVESGHPPFAPHSLAACVTLDAPHADEVQSIIYTPEDDAVIENFVRDRVQSMWHGIATCKMAPRELGGVVDEQLGVHGVLRLKVADLSIVPANVAANTAATAFAIGEKAADIVIHELGLNL